MKEAIRLGDKEPKHEFWKMVFKDIIYKQGFNVLLLLLGFILVPIAVLFRKEEEWPEHITRPHYEGWKYYTTHIKFLRVYVGDVGFCGDGTFPKSIPSWVKKFGMTSRLANITWAWRNPVGGYDREFNIGCRLTEDSQIYYYGDPLVGDDGDGEGRHFVITKTPKGIYRGYYKVTVLDDDPNKCKRIRAGYKVKPYYNYKDWDGKAIDATFFSYTTKNYKTPINRD